MSHRDAATTVTRRTFLGASGAAALAGGAGVASAQSEPYDGWFTGDARGGETGSFDGTVDRTGESEVTVEVGATGNGGTFAYAPTAVRVDPGTTIQFSWSTDNHNVVVESQPDGAGWEGHESLENTGFEFSHTFDTEGIYTYFCQPHLSVGMKGAIVVGDADVGGASGGGDGGATRPDFGDWLLQDGEQVAGGYTDARGQSEVTVDVGAPGNGGTYAFAPANLWIDPGTTVRFRWSSDNHNVVVESQPDDADWSGYESVENSGFEFTHTFETGGLYEYFCQPHLSLGMKGGIAVGDNVPTQQVGGATGADGGGGGATFQWPENDLAVVLPGLVFGIGGLLGVAILAGELYNDRKEALANAPAIEGPPMEAPEAVPEVEIEHDEYDPVGTALLIAGFFLVLVFMWIFVYFVEFLGNGPTIVG